MKFTTLLSAITLGSLSFQAAAQDTTVSTRYQLSVQTQLPGVVYPTLMFANGSAYIGNIKYNTYSEPLLRTSWWLSLPMNLIPPHALPSPANQAVTHLIKHWRNSQFLVLTQSMEMGLLHFTPRPQVGRHSLCMRTRHDLSASPYRTRLIFRRELRLLGLGFLMETLSCRVMERYALFIPFYFVGLRLVANSQHLDFWEMDRLPSLQGCDALR
jgi:hypothetical protein